MQITEENCLFDYPVTIAPFESNLFIGLVRLLLTDLVQIFQTHGDLLYNVQHI